MVKLLASAPTALLLAILPAVFVMAQSTPAPVTAAIAINTAASTPVAPNFSGVSADLNLPVEYWDYRFNALALTIGFGWVRFPGGASSDIYNWQTGEDVQSWFEQFPAGSGVAGTQNTVYVVAGLGGARLINAANRANLLAAQLIICVNGYTDTAASAGLLAQYVKANNIQVAAWELSNEPYLYPSFWPTAAAYLDAMKPYRDAIKAVLPNAVVAVFASDQAHANASKDPWNLGLAAYANKYWDAITYHAYPAQSTGEFSQWMADESAALATVASRVSANLAAIGPAGVKALNTEFDPSIPNDATTGASSITDGTLWGGIYSAEYIMRMSTVPALQHVGPSEISYQSGVLASADYSKQVAAAGKAGTTVNTLSLNYGFYVSAQGAGISVLNGVLKNAVQSDQTTVTGGATVPATGMANIPALYAMSYSNAQGGLSTVITNKSATPHQVTVTVNGVAVAGTFPLQYVTAGDPSTANTSTVPNAITVQTASSGNPITVPPYSVLRADISKPAVATFVNSASFQPGAAAPQELVTAFGSGFASQTIPAPPGQPFPVMLGDTTISITDSKGVVRAAPLYYVSESQASFLIPSGVATGSASVKVARSGATVLTGSLTIASVSPGLYAANGNGSGVAAALAANYPPSGAATPIAVFTCQSGAALSCLSSPLNVSSPGTVYVSLYGTGIRGAGTVQAYVAGAPATVQFAGAQGEYQGLDQVNVAIPSSLAGMGEVSLYLVTDGATSNMVTIKIE